MPPTAVLQIGLQCADYPDRVGLPTRHAGTASGTVTICDHLRGALRLAVTVRLRGQRTRLNQDTGKASG